MSELLLSIISGINAVKRVWTNLVRVFSIDV